MKLPMLLAIIALILFVTVQAETGKNSTPVVPLGCGLQCSYSSSSGVYIGCNTLSAVCDSRCGCDLTTGSCSASDDVRGAIATCNFNFECTPRQGLTAFCYQRCCEYINTFSSSPTTSSSSTTTSTRSESTSVTPSVTPSPSVSRTPSTSQSPSSSETPSNTPSETASVTSGATPSETPSILPSQFATPCPTSEPTLSATAAPTVSATRAAVSMSPSARGAGATSSRSGASSGTGTGVEVIVGDSGSSNNISNGFYSPLFIIGFFVAVALLMILAAFSFSFFFSSQRKPWKNN